MSTGLPFMPLPPTETGPSAPRRTPSQERSRERLERILTVAAGLLAARGSDALRMSDVAAEAGVSIGSLYQYFPDKASIVRSLAERFNAHGIACVERDLAGADDLAGLARALDRSIDGYYRMFLELPAMREIWSGTQADKTLQAIDIADVRGHAALLASAVERLALGTDRHQLETVTVVLMQAVAANVRLAVSLEQPEAVAIIAATKRLLTRQIAAEFFGGADR